MSGRNGPLADHVLNAILIATNPAEQGEPVDGGRPSSASLDDDLVAVRGPHGEPPRSTPVGGSDRQSGVTDPRGQRVVLRPVLGPNDLAAPMGVALIERSLITVPPDEEGHVGPVLGNRAAERHHAIGLVTLARDHLQVESFGGGIEIGRAEAEADHAVAVRKEPPQATHQWRLRRLIGDRQQLDELARPDRDHCVAGSPGRMRRPRQLRQSEAVTELRDGGIEIDDTHDGVIDSRDIVEHAATLTPRTARRSVRRGPVAPDTALRGRRPPGCDADGMVERIVVGTIAPPRGWSHAVRTGGSPLVFISGMVPMAPDGSIAVGLEAQAQQVCANLAAVFDDLGLAVDHTVKETILIVAWEPAMVPALQAARGPFWGDTIPASTLVGVHSLARAEYLIEVEAMRQHTDDELTAPLLAADGRWSSGRNRKRALPACGGPCLPCAGEAPTISDGAGSHHRLLETRPSSPAVGGAAVPHAVRAPVGQDAPVPGRGLVDAEIHALPTSERIVRVAFSVGDVPYVVPLGYVWVERSLWGTTRRGRKTEMAETNPQVGFEVDDSAASPPFQWRSCVGSGQFEVVDLAEFSAVAGTTMAKVFDDNPE